MGGMVAVEGMPTAAAISFPFPISTAAANYTTAAISAVAALSAAATISSTDLAEMGGGRWRSRWWNRCHLHHGTIPSTATIPPISAAAVGADDGRGGDGGIDAISSTAAISIK